MYHSTKGTRFLCFTVLLLACVGATLADYMLPPNVVPEFDICANGGDSLTCSNHGKCVSGRCACTDGYTGRDCSMPPGGFNFPNPIPQARATMFANLDGSDGQLVDTTCFGTNYPVTRDYLPAGVTGVVAVNPTLYGSRFAFGSNDIAGQHYTSKSVSGSYSGVGQSCGHCFKLTRGSRSVVAIVVNRCGGYCKANGLSGPCNVNGTSSTDCGYCTAPNAEVKTTVDCSCMSQMAIQTNGYCDPTGIDHHCDHCAQNDHPHFDLDTDSLHYLCNSNAVGVCDLDSFQWVQCSGLVKQSGDFPNGGTPYVLPSNAIATGSSSSTTGQNTVAPTRAPTPAPTPTPTPAPTQAPTPAPTQAPTPPTQAPTPPTQAPTPPTQAPTPPTQAPTPPTQAPTPPTQAPTPPTQAPTPPTQAPTPVPTQPSTPTRGPTPAPTRVPIPPTQSPPATLPPATPSPTQPSTQSPTRQPSTPTPAPNQPVTPSPTQHATLPPSTQSPSPTPSIRPTPSPSTQSPTQSPTQPSTPSPSPSTPPTTPSPSTPPTTPSPTPTPYPSTTNNIDDEETVQKEAKRSGSSHKLALGLGLGLGLPAVAAASAAVYIFGVKKRRYLPSRMDSSSFGFGTSSSLGASTSSMTGASTFSS